MAAEAKPRFMSMAEAADRLGVSHNTLRKWSDEGRVPTVRRPGGGGYRRFDPDVIERVAREMGIER
jgi:excisionase family DNA binding protein